ncbi:YjdJ family protein [Peribacillus simplex]|uniref:YjdJ family protein n=1 Tax=Peribacillus simplex TaxID=1478 RepID=UPI003D26F0F0
MKYFDQSIIAGFFLLLFSFCTWYEGSEILDDSREWKYSAHFSQMLNDQVVDDQDISNLDYFVYAAKFKPVFPVLMVLTSSYLIILTGYALFKRSSKKTALFLVGYGVFFLILSGIVSNSPTVGGNIFQAIFLISGMMAIIGAALYYFRIPKEIKTDF